MFKVLQHNPQLINVRGVYQNPDRAFKETDLSAELIRLVGDAFEQAHSKAPFSPALEKELITPDLSGALSPKPINFLRGLNLSKVNTALDLTNDFGAVTHFLSDHVGSVESVITDSQRARLAARRLTGRKNTVIILDDVEQLQLPSASYDLIVIGALESLALEQPVLTRLLAALKAALTPTGVVLINAQNTHRLSTTFGRSPVIESGGPAFSDLYRFKESALNAPINTQHATLTALQRFLAHHDFGCTQLFATFSASNDYENLFSEDYLTTCVSPLNHFYRISTLDRDDLNEYLVYRQLHQNKQPLIDVASRYLFILGADKASVQHVYANDFMHYAGTGRKPCWRTHTYKVAGTHKVIKQLTLPDSEQKSALITQDVSAQSFQKGDLLVNYWLDCVLDDNADAFTQEVKTYAQWLESLAGNATQFQKEAYDALPFNVLVTEKKDVRQLSLIDKEWGFKERLDPQFVVFRALFWFAFENQSVLSHFCQSLALHSLESFIAHFMPLPTSFEQIAEWAELEERVQADISNSFSAGSITLVLKRAFDASWQPEQQSTYGQAMWLDQQNTVFKEGMVSTPVQKQEGLQSLTFSLGASPAAFDRLRIDPVASKGCFYIERMVFKDSGNRVITEWDEATLIERSELNNLHIVAANDEGAPHALWVALNDDPYCVLTLDTDLIANTRAIELAFYWVFDAQHSVALASLTQAMSDRETKLQRQAHRIILLENEADFLHSQINFLNDHLQSTKKALKLTESNPALREELKEQRRRNHELYTLLLARPSTRIKAFASRMVKRVLRRPYHASDPDVFQEPEPAPKPQRLRELIGQNTEDYALWVTENDLSQAEIEAAKRAIGAMAKQPVFSILVPVYNTPPEYLIPMIRSVQAQIYPFWELCLVDDCSPDTHLRYLLKDEAAQDERIKIILNSENHGISSSTNDALTLATGDFIALLDHDDELSIDALYQNAKVINERPEVGLIYSDEDKMDLEGNRLEPCFKPDYSPDMLQTNNYVCHFTVIKMSIIEAIGGFREGLDGSQDHDIILRAAAAAEAVHHIPRILYHWRKIPGSTAVEYNAKSYAWEAGRKSVENSLRQQETGVRVELGSLKGTYKVVREIKGSPRVSIIIPFKDKPELLRACVQSILQRSTYANIEVLGVNNQSSEATTLAAMSELAASDERIRFIDFDAPFNFSAICNAGVAACKGEYVVLLNNDVEIISPDWVERLLEHAQRKEIGAVGGKLLYPDGRIQHAGIVVGMTGAAGHPHRFFPDNHIGYHGRLHMVTNVSAVTGALLMVSRAKYNEVNGLDDKGLPVAYNDVDFCLKLLAAGYYNVFTPHAKATHYESVSRGYEHTPEKQARLQAEQTVFLTRWKQLLAQGDPFYNPNLSLSNEKFSLKFRA